MGTRTLRSRRRPAIQPIEKHRPFFSGQLWPATRRHRLLARTDAQRGANVVRLGSSLVHALKVLLRGQRHRREHRRRIAMTRVALGAQHSLHRRGNTRGALIRARLPRRAPQLARAGRIVRPSPTTAATAARDQARKRTTQRPATCPAIPHGPRHRSGTDERQGMHSGAGPWRMVCRQGAPCHSGLRVGLTRSRAGVPRRATYDGADGAQAAVPYAGHPEKDAWGSAALAPS